MTRDSFSISPDPQTDSPLPHTAEDLSDTLLWAAGLSKAAADHLDERRTVLGNRMEEFGKRMQDENLTPDEKANLESAISLIRTVQTELAPQGDALNRLAHMHSDHAKKLSARQSAPPGKITASPPMIPGDSAGNILRKSIMLAAETRMALCVGKGEIQPSAQVNTSTAQPS